MVRDNVHIFWNVKNLLCVDIDKPKAHERFAAGGLAGFELSLDQLLFIDLTSLCLMERVLWCLEYSPRWAVMGSKMQNHFLSNEFEDPTVLLGPLTGVDTVPIVSLLESVKSIANALTEYSSHTHAFKEHDLHYWVEIAFEAGQIKAIDDPNQLTADEIGSIHLYTQETNFYKLLNSLLRDTDRKKIVPFFSYLCLFQYALSKVWIICNLWRLIS